MRIDMNKKYAFTTAELMVAIAVLGVLAAMMIPALRYSVQKRVFEYSRDIQTKKLAQAKGLRESAAIALVELHWN